MNPHCYLDANQRGQERFLQRLVSIDTVNPPGRNYAELVAILEQRCRGLGLKTARHQVPAMEVRKVTGEADPLPRYNLIARWDVGASETVHFNAHYDVVPAAGKWRFGDPFEPAIAGGMVYGRGAGDMKGSIAALLMAVEAVQRSGATPAFNIECSFTADEETGGELGAGYIVRKGLVRADYAVVCEGAAGTRVGLGHNGVLWLRVSLKGKSAHAANPNDGVNAFEAMAQLVAELGAVKKKLASPRRGYVDHAGSQRQPTINVGGVFAGGDGDKVNTVPATAFFSIDRRILPTESVALAERELRKTIKSWSERHRAVRCRVERQLRIDPCVVDQEETLPVAFSGAVQSVRRHAVAFRVTSGFTDLHYFVHDLGLPGVGYGVNGQNVHGVDERVRSRDLLQTSKVYAEFMMRGLRRG